MATTTTTTTTRNALTTPAMSHINVPLCAHCHARPAAVDPEDADAPPKYCGSACQQKSRQAGFVDGVRRARGVGGAGRVRQPACSSAAGLATYSRGRPRLRVPFNDDEGEEGDEEDEEVGEDDEQEQQHGHNKRAGVRGSLSGHGAATGPGTRGVRVGVRVGGSGVDAAGSTRNWSSSGRRGLGDDAGQFHAASAFENDLPEERDLSASGAVRSYAAAPSPVQIGRAAPVGVASVSHKLNGFMTCTLCDKMFNDSPQIESHRSSQKHTKRLLLNPNMRCWKCLVCNCAFQTPEELLRHLNIHQTTSVRVHGDGDGAAGVGAIESVQVMWGLDENFRCDVCDQFFSSELQRLEHLAGKKHRKKALQKGIPIERAGIPSAAQLRAAGLDPTLFELRVSPRIRSSQVNGSVAGPVSAAAAALPAFPITAWSSWAAPSNASNVPPQLSDAGTRCNICDMELNSHEQLLQHLSGKKHEARSAAARGSVSRLSRSDPAPGEYRCNLCHITLSGPQPYADHIRGKKHKSKVASSGMLDADPVTAGAQPHASPRLDLLQAQQFLSQQQQSAMLHGRNDVRLASVQAVSGQPPPPSVNEALYRPRALARAHSEYWLVFARARQESGDQSQLVAKALARFYAALAENSEDEDDDDDDDDDNDNEDSDGYAEGVHALRPAVQDELDTFSHSQQREGVQDRDQEL